MLKSLFSYKYFNVKKSILVKKVLRRIIDRFIDKRKRLYDLQYITYSNNKTFEGISLNRFFDTFDITQLNFDENLLQEARKLLEHNFQVMAFGRFKGNVEDCQLANEEISHKGNLEYSRQLEKLIDEGYKRINWHCDFNSGYYWCRNNWYKDIKHCVGQGIDIKILWEIARMQHLLLLALLHLYYRETQSEYDNKYYKEYKNQIIDFVSANPPRFGLHWNCTMEVAIRVINMLVSYDILCNDEDVIGDEAFRRVFMESIYEHYVHIKNNLEWSSGLRGNHYLADIVGLLVCSAYLPDNEETRQSLAYSIQELISETLYQFNPDGSNFEGSTGYHFLSAELVFLAFIFLNILPSQKVRMLKNCKTQKFPRSRRLRKNFGQYFKISENLGKIIFSENFIARLKNIAKFCLDLVDEGGEWVQIGDYDGGRILDLVCNRDKLNAIHLMDIIFNIEYRSIVKGLFNKNLYSKLFPKLEKIDLAFSSTEDGLRCCQYPNFGLYIYKSEDYYFTVRCGDIGQKGKGGHSHNDQLAVTLSIGGKPFIVDAGTYCYTFDPEMRNLFRSTRYHNTLFIDGVEQNDIEVRNCDDLFWVAKHKTHAECLVVGDNFFSGEHYGFGEKCGREISFRRDEITILDRIKSTLKKGISFHFHPDVRIDKLDEGAISVVNSDVGLTIELGNYEELILEDYFFSPDYGAKVNAKRLVVLFIGEKLVTRMKIMEKI